MLLSLFINGNSALAEKKGAPVKKKWDSGPIQHTKLQYAAMHGHLEGFEENGRYMKGVRELVADNPSAIDKCNQRGQTALSGAVIFRHVDVVYFLIKSAGASISAGADNLLFLAITGSEGINEQNLEEVVRILIDADVPVNPDGVDGNFAPLHRAAELGQINVVKMLLKAGADATALTHDHNSPLHLASSHGHTTVVRLLCEYVRRYCQHEGELEKYVNQETASGMTPLYLAVIKNSFDGVEYLLSQREVNVSKKSRWGKTPLYGALELGNSKILEFLIKNGAVRDEMYLNLLESRSPVRLSRQQFDECPDSDDGLDKYRTIQDRIEDELDKKHRKRW